MNRRQIFPVLTRRFHGFLPQPTAEMKGGFMNTVSRTTIRLAHPARILLWSFLLALMAGFSSAQAGSLTPEHLNLITSCLVRLTGSLEAVTDIHDFTISCPYSSEQEKVFHVIMENGRLLQLEMVSTASQKRSVVVGGGYVLLADQPPLAITEEDLRGFRHYLSLTPYWGLYQVKLHPEKFRWQPIEIKRANEDGETISVPGIRFYRQDRVLLTAPEDPRYGEITEQVEVEIDARRVAYYRFKSINDYGTTIQEYENFFFGDSDPGKICVKRNEKVHYDVTVIRSAGN